MAFRCPVCQQANRLVIRKVLELSPDRRSDEITLQIVECSLCRFRGLAVFAESRRGRLDSESWEHTGYFLEPFELEKIQLAMEACPQPYQSTCSCSTHQRFGLKDGNGEWQGLQQLATLQSFPMIWSGDTDPIG